ncbi:alpha/beta hydrolase [Hyphobacterium sp.]|uniref:alpha/beta hydrolase n=1 Tax=Hyphobacterium sp. TaxID=2004662 RepID=UPI003B51C052
MTLTSIPKRFGLRLRNRLARNMARKAGEALGPDVDMEIGRKLLHAAGDRVPPDRSVSRADVELAGLNTLVFSPRKNPRPGQMLFIHGGGYSRGSAHGHSPFISRLAARLNLKTRAIDYRLAPEHPFPAGLDDCEAAYKALRVGLDGPLVLAGDSAGAGLALALCVRLKAQGAALPDALILYSPWCDLTNSAESMRTKSEIDPMFEGHWFPIGAQYYAPGDDRTRPEISPLFGDFDGFPPALIQVGSDEVLLDDSLRLEQRMSDAGVDVTCEVWDGMWHDFPMFQPLLPEGRMANKRARAWLDARLGA